MRLLLAQVLAGWFLRNSYVHGVQQWGTRQSEDEVRFPDIVFDILTGGPLVQFRTSFCRQRSSHVKIKRCPAAIGISVCTELPLSQVQATTAHEGENDVTCFFEMRPVRRSGVLNPARQLYIKNVTLTLPHGSDNPPYYVRNRISGKRGRRVNFLLNRVTTINLSRERFVAINGSFVDDWAVAPIYHTSEFLATETTFNATVIFHMPIRGLVEHYEYITFDQWQPVVVRGATFLLTIVSHWLVYSFTKRCLPHARLPPPSSAPSKPDVFKNL